MRNKYINFKKNPWSKTEVYMLELEPAFYEFLHAYKPELVLKNFSYFYILPDLFGMRPRDFFAYVVDHYHATVSKSGPFKNVNFSNIVDANNFANECNSRFAKVVSVLGTK